MESVLCSYDFWRNVCSVAVLKGLTLNQQHGVWFCWSHLESINSSPMMFLTHHKSEQCKDSSWEVKAIIFRFSWFGVCFRAQILTDNLCVLSF